MNLETKNTRVIGMKILCMDMVPINTLLEQFILDSGTKASNMDMESCSLLMVLNMMANGTITLCMVTVFTQTQIKWFGKAFS